MKWKMPGHLIIVLPDDGFSITDPEWSDDALGYEAHNRVGDFAEFGLSGMKSFRMTDQLQSDYHGNVYHEAVGILPKTIPDMKWVAIPCVRHDGPSHDVFASPETPEFIAFMKGLNPDYRSAVEISAADVPVEERLYAVMTDSHRPYDKSILARMAPERSRASGFWTSDSPDDVWLMDRETAEDIKRQIGHNNPRVVRSEKALKIIEAQKEARLNVKVEAPFSGQPEGPSQSPDIGI